MKRFVYTLLDSKYDNMEFIKAQNELAAKEILTLLKDSLDVEFRACYYIESVYKVKWSIEIVEENKKGNK